MALSSARASPMLPRVRIPDPVFTGATSSRVRVPTRPPIYFPVPISVDQCPFPCPCPLCPPVQCPPHVRVPRVRESMSCVRVRRGNVRATVSSGAMSWPCGSAARRGVAWCPVRGCLPRGPAAGAGGRRRPRGDRGAQPPAAAPGRVSDRQAGAPSVRPSGVAGLLCSD